MLLRQKSWIIALFHISLVTASFFFALLLRYDFQIKLPKLLLLLACLLLLFLSRLATLFVFIVATRVVIGPYPFHISIYVIEAMTSTAALGGVRLFALALNSKGPTRN